MAIDKFELEGIFEKFIEKCYEPDLQKAAIKGIESIQIDFLQLAKFNPDIAEQLLDNPREAISALETAMMHKMQEWISGLSAKQLAQLRYIGKYQLGRKAWINVMKARIINLPDSQNMLIKNISKEHIGKLISVDGKVISQSDVWLESICSKFECPACGAELLMMQSGDEIKQPSRCACGYKSSFKQLKTIFADVQELILQDLSDETKKKASQIRIIAKNDLAGAEMSRNTAEGKRICVYGIVEENKGTSGRSHKTPGRVIIANNIKPI